SDEVAATLSDLELFGLGPDEVNGFFHRVDSVTLAQANAALRNHFCSAVPRFVLVGNAAKLESVVSRYAPQRVNIALSSPGFNPAAGGPVVVSPAAATRPAGAVRPAKRNTRRR
ncbi:MAG: hypothetical protein M1541_15160, partial [Acidobacteria bacterium]|nr:hypothetical protein [Acidobacteriota bacterium]